MVIVMVNLNLYMVIGISDKVELVLTNNRPTVRIH